VSDDKNTYIVETVKELREDVKDIQKSVNAHVNAFSAHEASDRVMAADISGIRKTLERNTDSLEKHMKRTDLNEASVNILKDIMIKIDSRLHPLEDSHKEKVATMQIWKKIGLYAGVISAVVSIAYSIWSFTHSK